MHPTITAQIISARTADIRRRSERDQASRAARQARAGRPHRTPVTRRPAIAAGRRVWPISQRHAH